MGDRNKDGSLNYTEFVQWLFGVASTQLPEDFEKKLWSLDALKQVISEASTGNAESAVNLLERDSLVHPSAADTNGTTILMAAVKGGSLALVKSLLEMDCGGINAVDQEGNTALDYAYATGNSSVLEYMTHGHTHRDNSVKPFIRALLPGVFRGDAESVQHSVLPRVTYSIYIDRHINEYHGLTLMPCANKTLLIKKIDAGLVDDWNKKTIDLPVKPGDHVLKVNEATGDAKALSLELGKFQEMTITLQRYWPEEGFDPNLVDERGSSALHHAVRQGHKSVVGALLDADAILVNVKDRYDRTALDIATEKGDDEMIAMLQKSGAKLGASLRVPP